MSTTEGTCVHDRGIWEGGRIGKRECAGGSIVTIGPSARIYNGRLDRPVRLSLNWQSSWISTVNRHVFATSQSIVLLFTAIITNNQCINMPSGLIMPNFPSIPQAGKTTISVWPARQWVGLNGLESGSVLWFKIGCDGLDWWTRSAGIY